MGLSNQLENHDNQHLSKQCQSIEDVHVKFGDLGWAPQFCRTDQILKDQRQGYLDVNRSCQEVTEKGFSLGKKMLKQDHFSETAIYSGIFRKGNDLFGGVVSCSNPFRCFSYSGSNASIYRKPSKHDHEAAQKKPTVGAHHWRAIPCAIDNRTIYNTWDYINGWNYAV